MDTPKNGLLITDYEDKKIIALEPIKCVKRFFPSVDYYVDLGEHILCLEKTDLKKENLEFDEYLGFDNVIYKSFYSSSINELEKMNKEKKIEQLSLFDFFEEDIEGAEANGL